MLKGGEGADDFTTDEMDEVFGGYGLDRFDGTMSSHGELIPGRATTKIVG
jgi:hypothetical protein